MNHSTTSFDEACKICKPFRKLSFSKDTLAVLNSGKILFYFSESPSAAGVCFPSFPINPAKEEINFMLENNYPLKEATRVATSIKKEGLNIPDNIKVIISTQQREGKVSRLVNEGVEKFMIDCFGHALLYLHNPKASNECEDAVKYLSSI